MAKKLYIPTTRAQALAARRLVNIIMGERKDGTAAPFPRAAKYVSGETSPVDFTRTYIRVIRNIRTGKYGLLIDDHVQARVATCPRLTAPQRTAITNAITNANDYDPDWDDGVEDDDDS